MYYYTPHVYIVILILRFISLVYNFGADVSVTPTTTACCTILHINNTITITTITPDPIPMIYTVVPARKCLHVTSGIAIATVIYRYILPIHWQLLFIHTIDMYNVYYNKIVLYCKV